MAAQREGKWTSRNCSLHAQIQDAQHMAPCGEMLIGEHSQGADGGAEEGQGLRVELQDAHAAPDARAPQPHRPVRARAGDQGCVLDG